MADNRPIGVFDSGLGGLTVVKELKRLLPNENIIYFGDTGRVPYGTRSNDIVKRYAREDEAFLKIIFLKVTFPFTTKELPVPFIEVVTPAALAAANATKNNKIGVIGTSVTVGSRSHARAILKTLPDAVIVANACPLFVSLVEEGWISPEDPVTNEVAKRYLEPIVNADVDTLIMGCTHYPALRPILQKIMGDKVTLIDPGLATAMQVKDYLTKANALAESKTDDKYFVSDRANTFSKVAKILMGESIEDKVEQIDIFKYI